jgi:hypothetical protein
MYAWMMMREDQAGHRLVHEDGEIVSPDPQTPRAAVSPEILWILWLPAGPAAAAVEILQA